jgi:hypothetical protein
MFFWANVSGQMSLGKCRMDKCRITVGTIVLDLNKVIYLSKRRPNNDGIGEDHPSKCPELVHIHRLIGLVLRP